MLFSHVGLYHPSFRAAKRGGAVNGGHSPFILTVDWLSCLCNKLHYELTEHLKITHVLIK
ncbi:hypothetical protein D7X88_06765 [bacterium C-53]|nr:hypothetical protein [Lachnospiraceae bacterium]NBI02922.1 hypothetical protein [Lachnospiraceae bacterium]RKJ11045.1 hypothetical protein D7X88_06765 [bacterium C-53]